MSKNTDVLDWMKKTDLVEVSFKAGGEGFTFALGGAAPAMPKAGVPLSIPSSSSITVNSPSVGFYHAAGPGKSGKPFQVGATIHVDSSLGFLEAGPKRWEIKSPAAGTIEQVLIEEGQPAQYGQPLFVIKGS